MADKSSAPWLTALTNDYSFSKTVTPNTTETSEEPCTFVKDFMTGAKGKKQKESPTVYVAKEEDFVPHDLDYMKTEHEITEGKEKVNHPSHYNSVKVETIKILEDYLTDDEYAGFLKGNVLKYIHRYKFKNGAEDLNKAKWYLEELIRFNSKENS